MKVNIRKDAKLKLSDYLNLVVSLSTTNQTYASGRRVVRDDEAGSGGNLVTNEIAVQVIYI